ncbi:MAG: hypothetical protein M4D85_00500 [Actinomycetota bacterium]|nr:hypothetical protein [Actinomycetota bacterium]
MLQILVTDPGAAVISIHDDTRAQVEKIVVALDEARADALRRALEGRVDVTSPGDTGPTDKQPADVAHVDDILFPPPGTVLPPLSLPDP